MSVAFRSSKRRRRLIEAMVLLRDWPLVLIMWFANFLTNIMAWGPCLQGLKKKKVKMAYFQPNNYPIYDVPIIIMNNLTKN